MKKHNLSIINNYTTMNQNHRNIWNIFYTVPYFERYTCRAFSAFSPLAFSYKARLTVFRSQPTIAAISFIKPCFGKIIFLFTFVAM